MVIEAQWTSYLTHNFRVGALLERGRIGGCRGRILDRVQTAEEGETMLRRDKDKKSEPCSRSQHLPAMSQ